MILFSYDKIDQYKWEQDLLAIVIIGFLFFILGWILSRLLRPSNKPIQQELHNIKKELLEELNTAKKFNADYQLLAKKEANQNNNDSE